MVDGDLVDGWWNFPKVPGRSRDNYCMVKVKVQMEAFSQCHLGLQEGNYEVFPHW